MTLYLSGHHYKYELLNLTRMFFPMLRLTVVDNADVPTGETGDYIVATREEQGEVALLNLLVSYGGKFTGEAAEVETGLENYDAECERIMAVMLYKILERMTGLHPRWGILTGIRPVKLVEKELRRGKSPEQVVQEFEEKLLASPDKTKLLLDVAQVQAPVRKKLAQRGFSLYVSIPFCPSRCHYCSFVSHSIENAGKLLPEYLIRLQEELSAIAEIANQLKLELQTIYIGGGTPAVLSAVQLKELLGHIRNSFDCSRLLEYTLEAGRADVITADKLLVAKEAGVQKVSINPQSMNDKVLEQIGRRHTAGQVREAYQLARDCGFENINMDLITGLMGDTYESFCSTLDEVAAMGPESITIHTLSVKRSAALYYDTLSLEQVKENPAARMNAYGQQKLVEEGYLPYYLYRQKNTLQNLENVGFCKPGNEGVYNIAIMEELQTILATGAGAVTKLVSQRRQYIERVFNFKYPYEYLDRYEQILSRKEQVIRFYETEYGNETF